MSRAILPQPVTDVADTLASLPGIGPKLASRLAVYLASSRSAVSENILQSLSAMNAKVTTCARCGNLATGELCDVCSDPARSNSQLIIVLTPLDLLQIEQSRAYSGKYLVLGKLISPVNGVSPKDTNIHLLENILATEEIEEIIIALGGNVEAEATAMYLSNLIAQNSSAKVTRLARGIPTGADIEYLDEETIRGALEGRRPI
jgi:recombination protein RecR